MIHPLLFAAFVLLVTIPNCVIALVSLRRCDIGARLACNNFRKYTGKLCALDPVLCYVQDAIDNEKNCNPETLDYCSAFKSHHGYLCTDAFCLVTVTE